MKIIAHRGLLDGPDPKKENHPDTILKALKEGFDVEVDIWSVNNKLFLGHDGPMYPIDLSFLTDGGRKKHYLWIHTKNIEAVEAMMPTFNHYFWHQNDDLTITSRGYIWVYPGKPMPKGIGRGICVLPENFMKISDVTEKIGRGVCTDFGNEIRSKLDKWDLY